MARNLILQIENPDSPNPSVSVVPQAVPGKLKIDTSGVRWLKSANDRGTPVEWGRLEQMVSRFLKNRERRGAKPKRAISRKRSLAVKTITLQPGSRLEDKGIVAYVVGRESVKRGSPSPGRVLHTIAIDRLGVRWTPKHHDADQKKRYGWGDVKTMILGQIAWQVEDRKKHP
jgi:hypothetical protein